MPGSPERMRPMQQKTEVPQDESNPSLSVLEGGNPNMPPTTPEQRAAAGPELHVVQNSPELASPQSVLERASALLDGAPIALDAASYTQRILKSVEGKSTAEIQDLAERYARSTHPAEGVPVPSAEMLQELAMTAAILEAKVAADKSLLEAPTTVLDSIPQQEVANTNPVTEEAIASQVSTTEAANTAMPAEEPATVQIEGRDGEQVSQWQQRRVQLLNEVLGLTAAATLAEAEKVANALGSEKAEDALAELRAIDARLTGAGAALGNEEMRYEESPTELTERAMPTAKQEATPVMVEEVQDEVDPAEADTELIDRSETEETVDANEAEDAELSMERIRGAIEADINGLGKTLDMYRTYEADLSKQYSGLDKFFARLGLSNEKKRKGVERLRHIQVAIAHVEESIANLNTQLVELENADNAFQELVEEALAEQQVEMEKEEVGVMKMMEEAGRVQPADDLTEEEQDIRARQLQRRAGKGSHRQG